MAAINWATYFTGLPLDDNGWTVLTPSTDSRLFYISNSEGNDSTAKFYLPDDSEIGIDPRNPVGEVKPFSTLSAVWTAIRSGQSGVVERPDWILYKRDEEWNGQPGRINNFAGRSKTERMVMTSYGTGARPVFNLTSHGIQLVGGGGNQNMDHNWIIEGLHFKRNTSTSGIRILRANQNWLVENCFFDQASIAIQGDKGRFNYFVLRRNAIYGTYTIGSGHNQGIYVTDGDILLIEDNNFDHCGTNPDGDRSDATRYNHNMYLQYRLRGVITKENITSRASATGIMQRPGGIIEHNLAIDNPIHYVIGTVQSGSETWRPYFNYVNQNLALGGLNINQTTPRGMGYRIEHGKESLYVDNFATSFRNGTSSISPFTLTALHPGNKVINNLIYNWQNNGSGNGLSISNTGVADGFEGTEIIDNLVIQPNGGSILSGGTDTQVIHKNNIGYSASTNISREGWTNLSEPYPFSDPGRDIFRYCNEVLGQSFTDIDEAQLWYFEQLRNMHRGNWDERFRAEAVINWIRAGYDREPISEISLRMVPEVAGLTQAEATALLEAEDLVVAVVEVEDPAVEEGNVISADIQAYRFIPEGSTVTLTVSGEESGSDFAPIPDVVGQERNAAIAALLEAGFEVSRVWSAINEAPVDQVISQNPIAGTEWLKTESGGSPVAITVSIGTGGGFVPTSGRSRASLEENFIR